MEILIAEDEKQIANVLKKNFLEEGHNVMLAQNGEEALDYMKKIEFDMIILDWKMPKLSGIEVCRQIRETGSSVPVIMLTALSETSSKVDALNAGADDYITKPFSFDEVLARVNAVKRRTAWEKDIIEFDDLTLNLLNRTLTAKNGNDIHLTEKEFEILKFFIDNKGEILNKEMLCNKIWNLSFVPQTNICEAAVKNLRKKLEEFTGKKYIKTIYGEGYILIAE